MAFENPVVKFFGSAYSPAIESIMGRDIESIAREIVDSSVKVHTALEPGLLESSYQRCLVHALRRRCLEVKTEVPLALKYEGIQIGAGYRLDVVLAQSVIVENKTVAHLLPIHQAQLLTYLKLSGCRIGFLLNWNVRRMKDGIRRMIWQDIRTREPAGNVMS